MLRRYNATGRKTISKEDASVRIQSAEVDQSPVFKVDLDLEQYDFAPEAMVRIEASRSIVVERWDAGTVHDVIQRGHYTDYLKIAPTGSQFKIVVVSGDGTGRLLGASGPIAPILPVESLIALRPADIESEVWRVSFGDSDLPELLVNNQLETMSEIVRNDAQFRSLVMPQVLRTVLTQIIFVDGADYDDDELSWHKGWFNLAQSLHGRRPPKVTDDADSNQAHDALEWIDQVVGEFSKQKVHAADLYRDVRQTAS